MNIHWEHPLTVEPPGRRLGGWGKGVEAAAGQPPGPGWAVEKTKTATSSC